MNQWCLKLLPIKLLNKSIKNIFSNKVRKDIVIVEVIHQGIAIYFFPIQYRCRGFSESGKQQPPTTRCLSPDASRSPPPAAGCAPPRPHSRVGGWCAAGNTVEAAEVGSQCLTDRSFGDCKHPAQPVSPWPLHRASAGSTLLQEEREVQCQRLPPRV